MCEATRDRPTEPGNYIRWRDSELEPQLIIVERRGERLVSNWGTPIERYAADAWWIKVEKPEDQHETDL